MNVDTVTEEPEVNHAPGSSDNRVRHYLYQHACIL